MGNDLNSWRAAVGNFYCITHPVVLAFMTSTNVLYIVLDLLKDIGNYLRYLFNCSGSGLLFNANAFLTIVIVKLLLLAGDVAKNTGPENDTGSLSILHLNVRSIRK